MLSHEDERRLAAIERQMLDDDPAFVRRFRRCVAKAMRAQRARGIVQCVVLCTFWALVGIGSSLALIGVVSGWAEVLLPGCALAAAASWEVRVLRRRAG